MKEGINAEVMAMTEATVTFKEVLTSDRTLLNCVGSLNR